VHNYYSGNSSAAISDLSAAIDAGSRDPRAYYFRALAEMKMGSLGNAEADMRMGAILESADSTQFYPVARALERVQGPARATLERYRSLARAEAYQRGRDNNLMRYEQLQRNEEKVLRNPPVQSRAPAAAPPAAKPRVPAPPVPAPPVLPTPTDDPFSEDNKMPATPDEPADAEEMPADDEADPFGEPPAKNPGKPSDNPFGDD
jgi:hypothetical protein